jgi:hypothetical protein
MKKLLSILLLLTAQAHAEWMLNPYTQRQDYYQPQPYVYVSSAVIDAHLTALDLSTAAIGASTAAIQVELDAVEVSTGAISLALTAETTTRLAADSAIGVTTGTLRSDLAAVILSTQALSLATHLNTGSTLIKRDASGNFSAGTITADGSALTGMDAYSKLASTQAFTGINTFTSSATFSSAVSTVTFFGYIDIGIERVVGEGSISTDYATCSSGKYIISGSCVVSSGNCTATFSDKYSDTQWQCSCGGAPSPIMTAIAICGRVKW